jgi:hypothetical protein
MNLPRTRYFFAADFVSRTFFHAFPLSSEMDQQLDADLRNKVNGLLPRIERISQWLALEAEKAGRAVPNNGKMESVSTCCAQYESEIMQLINKLSEFSEEQAPGDPKYLLYANCKLLERLAVTHHEFICDLGVKEYELNYIPNRLHIMEFLTWVAPVIADLKSVEQAYDSQPDDFLDELAVDWLLLLVNAANRHAGE